MAALALPQGTVEKMDMTDVADSQGTVEEMIGT